METGSLGRRTAIAVGVVALLALPAGVLRVMCVGDLCRKEQAQADIPFCSLPEESRRLISAGFREGRSPDVIPLTEETFDLSVPLIFDAPGIEGTIPEGASLDQVAPTIASLIGLERPHPEVRSGESLDISVPAKPKLVVVIVWAEVGTATIKGPLPVLEGLRTHAVSTDKASTGSWPADPTAVLATIGTGGLPRQHGITGFTIRDVSGGLVAPGSPSAPVSIISTLGDDLDEMTGGRARIGVIGWFETAKVAVGGNWYLAGDRDDVVVGLKTDSFVPREALSVLKSGYGDDDVPDLLVAVLGRRVDELDARTGEVIKAARKADPDALVIVTATGEVADGPEGSIKDRFDDRFGVEIMDAIDVWSRIWLDQKVLAREKIAVRDVVGALDDMFVDVFPATAIEFGRYC